MVFNFTIKHYLLKTLILAIFILLYGNNAVCSNDFNRIPKEYNHQNEIQNLRNLIITNADLARIKIDNLLLEHQFKTNPKLWIDYQILKIELYRFIGDFSHMKMELFNTMIKVNGDISNKQKMLLDYYRSINYFIKGDYSSQFALLNDLLKRSKKYEDPYIEATVLSTFGKYYFEKKDFITGRKYLLKARKIFTRLGDKYSILIVDIRTGIGRFWEGKDQLALSIFHKCLQFCIQNNLKINQYYLLVNIGETHLFSNQLDSAKTYYYQFLDHKENADIRDVFQTYMGLELYYNKIHNIDSAYHYSQLMHQIDDSIKSTTNKNLNEEIEKSFEREQNQKLINHKDEVIKNIKKTNRLILTFLILGSVLVLFIISMILYAYRTKNKMNKVLVEQQRSIIEKNHVIDAALKEKVILLKEIHHRVKNNLQIISSLLNLQSRSIKDKEALNALEEGKERIQAIALIHQKLYQNDTFEFIDMENYITDLIDQLHKTYVSSEKQIKFDVQSKNVLLNLDTAVPIGLIICELITNALKHAFNNRTKGLISLKLYQINTNNSYVFEIHDNGVGFDILKLNNGLGNEIIDALTDQLDGEKNIFSSEHGTLIKIHFKKIGN